MSAQDLELRIATVFVRRLWTESGSSPLAVELCPDEAAQAWAWEREAQRWLDFAGQSRREGRKPDKRDFLRGAQVPGWWDEMVGRYPGESDPILSKEFVYRDKYYLSGPVRTAREVVKGPVTS